jgi:hypothetical protein
MGMSFPTIKAGIAMGMRTPSTTPTMKPEGTPSEWA